MTALVAGGAETETVDISGLLDAARLLYDGAVVAQRYAAAGEFLETRPAGADPAVSDIVLGAKHPTGYQLVDDLDALTRAKAAARALLAGFDALLLPTTTEHPTIAAVTEDAFGINRRMGTFTNFCNLLDMAAVAAPGHRTAEDHPFGVMFVVPAFDDQIAIDLAARLGGVPSPALVNTGIDLAVFGAHLRGQPLNTQLVDLGARYVETVTTSDAYRLFALDTTPPKPGLVRRGPGLGAPVVGEIFRITGWPGNVPRRLACTDGAHERRVIRRQNDSRFQLHS